MDEIVKRNNLQILDKKILSVKKLNLPNGNMREQYEHHGNLEDQQNF